MGRKSYLKEPRQINIVLEAELLKEIDRIAGVNNRSATIRELIRNARGSQVQEMLELRRKSRELEKTVREQGKRIEELEQKLKTQRTEKSKKQETDSKRAQIEKYYHSYEQWRHGLKKNNSEYTFERGILWIESRARRVHTAPEQLLNEFEERFNTEQSGEQWDHT